MRLRLRLGAALVLAAAPGAALAADGVVDFMSWGGALSAAQTSAWVRPFERESGVTVRMIDSDNPAIPLKAQVEAGNVQVDLATVDQADAIRLCDEGLLAPIDPASLAPAPDGTPSAEDFLPGALTPCFAPADIYSTITAYNGEVFREDRPTTLADFFDLKRFPGRRGLHASAKATLEMALMADGVPAAQVYDLLATPEGQARAFAKLDTIKDQVVWWDAGAQAAQLLADGEVAMTASYSGRIVDAIIQTKKPFQIIWDGQVTEVEGFVIPKGAPDEAAARKLIAFATTAPALAEFTRYIGYGPARRSGDALVTTSADGRTAMAPYLPTTPANQATALASSNAFWAEHDSQLAERFAAWLAQ